MTETFSDWRRRTWDSGAPGIMRLYRLPIWCNAHKQGDKAPYQTDGSFAKNNEPATWRPRLECGADDWGVGLMLPPHGKMIPGCIVFIEGDNVLAHDTDADVLFREKFVMAADTYTPYSRSRTGLHVYLECTESFKVEGLHARELGGDHHGYELYTEKRFCIVSGEIYAHRPLRVVTPAVLHDLLLMLGYPWKKTPPPEVARGRRPVTQPEEDGIIQVWNRTHKIVSELRRYGYTINADNTKFVRPGKTLQDGISGTIDEDNNTAYTFSLTDAAHDGDTSKGGDGCTIQPFDLLRIYDHNGDAKAAVKRLYQLFNQVRP